MRANKDHESIVDYIDLFIFEDDSEMFKIKSMEISLSNNNPWGEYMDDGDTVVFSYVRYGTGGSATTYISYSDIQKDETLKRMLPEIANLKQ